MQLNVHYASVHRSRPQSLVASKVCVDANPTSMAGCRTTGFGGTGSKVSRKLQNEEGWPQGIIVNDFVRCLVCTNTPALSMDAAMPACLSAHTTFLRLAISLTSTFGSNEGGQCMSTGSVRADIYVRYPNPNCGNRKPCMWEHVGRVENDPFPPVCWAQTIFALFAKNRILNRPSLSSSSVK